ncbi:hypothetical protein [Agarivorans litoreus]|uniref:hypothetical protein n=1 Tax=Agarivorans litoreus TaxID=1510455 RepID=UPI001C7D3201|nr:hypothetical protein [Agarivorans litoreus]
MAEFSTLNFFQNIGFVFFFYILLRKQVVLITEPSAVIFIILGFSFSFVWLMYGYSNYTLIIFLHLLTFFLSINFGAAILRLFRMQSLNNTINSLKFCNKGFVFFTWCCFFVVLIANLYHINKAGIAILSESVDEAKTMGFSGGGGLVRRINWSLLYFNFISLFVLYRLKRERSFLVGCLTLALLLLLSGSKGAIISILLLVSVTLASPRFFKGNRRVLNYKLIFFGGVGILFAGFIYFLSSTDVSSALSKLYLRFLYFGDVNLYLANSYVRLSFESLDLFSLLNYIFNPLLGFFRLADYYTPIGVQLVHTFNAGRASVDGDFGPNLSFYATAILFFGDYFGLIFSSGIGVFFGAVRTYALQVKVSRLFRYCLSAYAYFMLYSLVLDPLMFIGRVYDSIILIGTCYLLFFSIRLVMPKK